MAMLKIIRIKVQSFYMHHNVWNMFNQDTLYKPGLILGLRPANERRRYTVTPSLIG